MKYNAYGLVKEIRKVVSSTERLLTKYEYDDRGNRVLKTNYDPNTESNPAIKNTFYVYDASGNVLAIYDQPLPSGTLVLSEVPVYGAGRIAVYKPSAQTTFYEVVDHLGNVRGVIGKPSTLTYTATMEDNGQAVYTNPRVQELAYFKNLSATEKADEDMNHTSASTAMPVPEYSSFLHWISGQSGAPLTQSIGPAIGLKVEPGDKLDLETWAKFEKISATYSRTGIAGTMASILGNNFVGTAAGIDVIANATQVFNNGITYAIGTLAGNGNDDANGRPYAYLYYLLYDKTFNLVTAGWSRIPVSAGFDTGYGAVTPHQRLSIPTITINDPGYIYIFVANESENVKVWFDDLKIDHQRSDIVAGADYYPFGLVMENREITREDYRYGYQGQFSEKDLTTGMQEFELRMYDPRIGRWISPDPYGQFDSPYLGMGNIPHMGTDPDGGLCCGEAMEDIYAAAMQAQAIAVMDEIMMSGVLLPAVVGATGKAGWGFWETAGWIAKDVGHFATSNRILHETNKGFLGATKLTASINYGYTGIDTGWDGGYDDTALKFGQGASVLTSVYTMGAGGLSPGGSSLLATRNGNVPVTQPGAINLGTTMTKVHTLSAEEYPDDYSTENTKNSSAWYKSARQARNIARTKLGSNPVKVGPNKWRSRDGKWQYRAKPGDVADNHIHLERLKPETGEVLQNLHLRW